MKKKNGMYFEDFPVSFPIVNCKGEVDDHIFIHSRCHINEPTWVSLHMEGYLMIICSKCRSVVGKFEIARRPPLPDITGG